MKRFFCQCGQEVFFSNDSCEGCSSQLAFDPVNLQMLSGKVEDGLFYSHQDQNEGSEKSRLLCSQRKGYPRCNWLSFHPDNFQNQQCISCITTLIVPDLSYEKNQRRWQIIELAKKQMIYSLLSLHLPFMQTGEGLNKLGFHFLEDKYSNPQVGLEHVSTGHLNGLITLNVAEADDDFRAKMKSEMNESYRTILGHFRHEIGHYYFEQLIRKKDETKAQFREMFGNEKKDYQTALEDYYQNPLINWQENFITRYASSHPLEDWAESFAHYLHMIDTLESASAYQLCSVDWGDFDFARVHQVWQRVTQVMNGLCRSMGVPDPYPFILSKNALQKISLIHKIVQELKKVNDKTHTHNLVAK